MKDTSADNQNDPWAWADARLTPWGKPQQEDYDFRSWMKGASEELLKAGYLYEYARESKRFRCMLVIDRTPKEERFWSAGCPDHPTLPWMVLERKLDRHTDLLGSDWETWLRDFADELVANKSFAEVLRTSCSKVEEKLDALAKYNLNPKAVEPPGRYNIVPDREFGLRKLGLQEVVIDWRHFNNEQIFAEIARQRPETEPEPDRRGRKPQSKARLKELSAMRICKYEHDPWKRLKLTAKFCGYEGCVREAANYKSRCKAGYGNQAMENSAQVEMSRARDGALPFFKFLFPFPGEIPVNY